MNKETKEHIERTIELAKSGDPDAGPEYLEHCMNAVLSGTIDEPLRSELFLSLQTLKNLLTNKNTRARVDGLVAEAFLNTKQSGRPSDKFPEWRRQLAACDILLKKKGKATSNETKFSDDSHAPCHQPVVLTTRISMGYVRCMERTAGAACRRCLIASYMRWSATCSTTTQN